MDWFMGKGRRKDKDAPLVAPADSPTSPPLEDEINCDKVLLADWDRLVRLPGDIDRNEWLATHTMSFFDHVNMLYGSMSEYCTSICCPSMNGPNNTQYQWVDEKGKKNKCAAPQYVELVMAYAKKTLHDQQVFPTKYGNVFPSHYDTTVKKIHRLLFHVIAHLYGAHLAECTTLALHPHLNTLLEHFYTFSKAFSLVDDRELEVLSDLYEKLRAANVSSIQKDLMGDSAPEERPRSRPPTPEEPCDRLQSSSDGSYVTTRGDTCGSNTSSRPDTLCGPYRPNQHSNGSWHHSRGSSGPGSHNKPDNVLCADLNQSLSALTTT